MQTVVELPEFLRRAKQVGLSEEERANIIEKLAAQPDLSDERAETGGMRKLRVAAKGKGKSRGYRVITFFTGSLMPVFLVTVYAKNQKDDITDKEKQTMKSLSAILIDSYKRERT